VDNLKAAGVEEVIVYCVNDGAVMDAWATDQGVDKSDFITMMGDPSGVLTEKLDVLMSHPGPESVGIIGRCKRFAMYVEDGTIKIFVISEAEDDPAGDSNPEETLAPAMLARIKKLKNKDEM